MSTTHEPMTDTQIREYLAAHTYFQGMPPNFLAEIAECASQELITEQHLIFRQGTKASRFYIVLDGEVQIEIPAVSGDPAVIQLLGPDKLLGWSWLVPPHRWGFDARATKPTKLLVLDGDRLRQRCEQDSKLGYELLKRACSLMIERLDAARRRVIELYAGSSY
jgi:CRP/FNR family transcriptional regulator, cyclic AMP receptor protein